MIANLDCYTYARIGDTNYTGNHPQKQTWQVAWVLPSPEFEDQEKPIHREKRCVDKIITKVFYPLKRFNRIGKRGRQE